MRLTKEKTLNGVAVDELEGSIDGLKQSPELGKFKFRAHNKWINGAHCKTSIKDFCAAGEEDSSRKKAHKIEADEPVGLQGKDHGANATEALLHALASCLNTSFIYHATLQGVKIDELEFELEGDIDINGFLGLDENVRNGFQKIDVICKVKADASREELEELCQCAQDRSPVFDVVSHSVPVTVRLET